VPRRHVLVLPEPLGHLLPPRWCGDLVLSDGPVPARATAERSLARTSIARTDRGCR
jgi:hypothetical protein